MAFLPISLLPTSLDEAKRADQFDVVFITGDPYYDHPLSGVAILSRLVASKGYRVGIVAQPQADTEFQACGRPRLFFCITSGLLDSMLANYTPMLRKRENVLVPEHALIAYTQAVKRLYPGAMTVLGGVEATIRRFTHFDYKENALRRGVLNDTKADLLLFANAERSMVTLMSRVSSAVADRTAWRFEDIREKLALASLDGVAYRIKKQDIPTRTPRLPSFEDCVAQPEKFALLARVCHLMPDSPFIEQCGAGFIMHNRPAHPLREAEMDVIYALPFTRRLHSASKQLAFNEQMVAGLENSVVIGRGCWGSCSFCVIPLVQGKDVAVRSKESIVREIEVLYAQGRKVNDLTLPTLNMYGSRCELYNEPQQIDSPIVDAQVTVYNKTVPCNQKCVGCTHRVLSDDLYGILEAVDGLNRKYNGTLELRSAIRHDIILGQRKLFRKIMEFTQRLKIAPEHVSDAVLKRMNKGTRAAFEEFLEEYRVVNKEQGTAKNLVPYFVAAHPGSTMDDMRELRKYCEEHGLFVELAQVFTPTPGTLSTAMYYSGRDPLTNEEVYVPRTFREKKDQKNVLMESVDERELVDDNG